MKNLNYKLSSNEAKSEAKSEAKCEAEVTEIEKEYVNWQKKNLKWCNVKKKRANRMSQKLYGSKLRFFDI